MSLYSHSLGDEEDQSTGAPSQFSPDVPGLNGQATAGLASAGVGAAATTAQAILNSIAQDVAMKTQAQQSALDRSSKGEINQMGRDSVGLKSSMASQRGAENGQLKAGSNSIQAAFGGQENKASAVKAMVDNLASIFGK